jgi:hypothetical protein
VLLLGLEGRVSAVRLKSGVEPKEGLLARARASAAQVVFAASLCHASGTCLEEDAQLPYIRVTSALMDDDLIV